MITTPFKFLRPGKLADRELELVLVRTEEADPVKHHSPMYEFEMVHTSQRMVMGKIRLRIASAVALRYPGHIGFEVAKRFRGRRYAARSCQLLLPLAIAHGLKTVWVTVDPKNISSQKTCQIIGARYVETVKIPCDHEMYQDGSRYCRRYRLSLQRPLPNQKSPEPTAVGACSLRSQRRHDLVARQGPFAARNVVAVAVHVANRR